MILHVNVNPMTLDSLHQIEEMTGHPVSTMLEKAVEEGTLEILSKYARNPKYAHVFKEHFPDFVDEREEVRKDVIALLKDIHEEADHLMDTAPKNAPNIKRWIKEALKKLGDS